MPGPWAEGQCRVQSQFAAALQAITACAASCSRSFLAVCQVCRPSRSQVSIYELGPVASNRPVQTLQDLTATCFASSQPQEHGLLCVRQELNGRDGPVGRITAVAFSSASRASGVPEDEASRPGQVFTRSVWSSQTVVWTCTFCLASLASDLSACFFFVSLSLCLSLPLSLSLSLSPSLSLSLCLSLCPSLPFCSQLSGNPRA